MLGGEISEGNWSSPRRVFDEGGDLVEIHHFNWKL